MHLILQGHLLENFKGENKQDFLIYNSSKEDQLENFEINLFKEIIWLMGNLSCDSEIGFALISSKIAK